MLTISVALEMAPALAVELYTKSSSDSLACLLCVHLLLWTD